MALQYKSAFAFVSLIFISACGSGGDSEPVQSGKLVNGVEVADDAAPFVRRMVAVDPTGAASQCTGTFIGAMHYLTAAHCVVSETFGTLPPESIFVERGTNDFVAAAGVAVHPGYTGTIAQSSVVPGFSTPNDLAIVLVPGFEGAAVPVSVNAPTPGQQLLLYGFGDIGNGVSGASILRAGTANVIAVSEAEGSIYYNAQSGTDSAVCYGDSGGPAFARFSEGGPIVVVGVTSTGSPPCVLGGINANALLSSASNQAFINAVSGGMHLSN